MTHACMHFARSYYFILTIHMISPIKNVFRISFFFLFVDIREICISRNEEPSILNSMESY